MTALARPSFHCRRLASLLVSALLLLAATTGCDKSTSADETDESAASETAQTDEEADHSDESDDEESSSNETAKEQAGPLRGRVSPGDVTETNDDWGKRFEELEIDTSVAEKLTEVPPGAELTVYFGTWCGDSRREVPRLWKILESAGGDVPFSVEYIALDRNFEAGDVSLEGVDIDFVPTFVVKRKGDEVGRIVESSPDLLEKVLLALLDGEATGVISGRDDLN